jgi:Domain of unknown function (DUF4440)
MPAAVRDRRGMKTGAKIRFATLAAAACALVAAALSTAGTAQPLTSPTAQGTVLVQHFFQLLHDQDRAGLKALLSPSFQVVRSNGGVQNKASYVADPPKVDKYTISRLKGTRNGGVLVVSYQVVTTEVIGGVEQPTNPAPRLSVFHLQGGHWLLVAHANFGAIAT